jgi:hypothetical protein
MATQYFKDSGVKTEICEKIYHLLDHFIELASDPIIGDEGAITFSNRLEVFYEKPNGLMAKLEYLRSRLEDIRNKVEFSGLRKQLQDRMYEKMSQHDAIYQALTFIMYKIIKNPDFLNSSHQNFYSRLQAADLRP